MHSYIWQYGLAQSGGGREGGESDGQGMVVAVHGGFTRQLYTLLPTIRQTNKPVKPVKPGNLLLYIYFVCKHLSVCK